jgi:4-amino-4-deoxy-L-arabinose transferase-like glycosyltransferase
VIRRIEWILITAILLVYLLIAGQYAARTPDWQAPDEPAHYNYVRQIVDEGRLPVLKMGDWQQTYQEALTAYGFNPAVTDCIDPPPDVPCTGLDTVEYEDHQPPLYYLLQAPVYALTGGDLLPMRLWSALIGAGVVLATWAALRVLVPRWPGIALAAAGFVAFIPQHIAILASVSNDALAELIVGITLLAVIAYLRSERIPDADSGDPLAGRVRDVHPALLGVLVGLALITKTTIYFLGGIALLAVLLRWRRARWPWREAVRQAAWVLIPALLVGGIWWARNLSVYGGLDFAGLERHEAITIGQPRTGDYIDAMYGGSTRVYLENYAKTTFRSFWGQFGWMALPMPDRVYTGFLLFTLAVAVGVGVFGWRHRWPARLDGPQQDALIVFAAVIALVLAAYVLYNLDFIQFQGRYLYPALLPLAFLVAVGLSGWVSLAGERFPALAWLPVAVMMGLAVFAWYALDTYIVPNLPTW